MTARPAVRPIQRIQRVAQDERLARHAGFWWGLAEGTVFFIVPDVYISLAALFALRAGALAWLCSIAGSLAGVIVIYLLVAILRVDYLEFLGLIPGISGRLVEGVQASVAAGGLPYTPFLVSGGVPLKVYLAAAFSLRLSLGTVLIWTVFARIARIAPTFLVVAVIRLLFARRIDRHSGRWLAVWGIFWLGFYLFYFLRMAG